MLEQAEEDRLAFYAFPARYRSKLRSTNPLEQVNREIGRHADVVGIFPNNTSAIRLAGALLIEQNDEWLVSRRYLSVESIALVLDDERDSTEEVIEFTAAWAATPMSRLHHFRRLDLSTGQPSRSTPPINRPRPRPKDALRKATAHRRPSRRRPREPDQR